MKIVATVGLVASLLLVSGCGDDEPPPPAATGSPSPSDPAAPSSEPAESTPAVEPATGARLALSNASLRVPKGWREDADYGFDFVKQASSRFSSVTVSELPNEAASLDALARQQMRKQDEDLERGPDVVLGDGTTALSLVGKEPGGWIAVYGSIYLDAEWVIEFGLSRREYPTRAARDDVIASVLATWDSAAG